MPRILVTGNAGSGKSSLSQRLAHDLGLQAQSLDRIVWQPNWQKTPSDIKKQAIAKLVAPKSWLIDGVSSLALEKADVVIFLDLPLHRCIFNIIKRFLKNGLGTRPELPENCPEYIGVIKAIKVAFYFHKNMRLQLLAKPEGRNFIRIRSHAELNRRYPKMVSYLRTTK